MGGRIQIVVAFLIYLQGISIFAIIQEVKREEGQKISASLEIKKALLEKDMQVKDLAKLLNCTPENLYLKFKKDNWKEKDIEQIANVLGYEYVQKFIAKQNKHFLRYPIEIFGITKEMLIFYLTN